MTPALVFESELRMIMNRIVVALLFRDPLFGSTEQSARLY